MSQSPQYAFSVGDLGYLHTKLNEEAAPFISVISQRRSLQSSAPVFVANVARMITPHSPTQHAAQTPERQYSFETYHDNPGSMQQFGGSQGALNWHTEPFNTHALTDEVAYDNMGQAANHVADHPDAISNCMMQQPQQFQYARFKYPISESECFHDAYVIGDYHVLPSIERDFDLHPPQAPMTPEPEPLIHQPGGSRSSAGSYPYSSEETLTGDNSDIDGDYDTNDEYQPPRSTYLAQDKGDEVQYPTPEMVEEDMQLSFSEKQRKANVVIKQQAKEHSLAKRLGQDIRVVRKGHHVLFEGVYWKAPENDRTIPGVEADKYACVRKIVSAIRNNKGCKEVATSKMFLNRWGDDADHYTMEELENAAWDVVDTMVNIHIIGWTKKLLDQKLRDQVQKTMFCTFGERFDALIKLLTTSKRTCEDLLKSERFYTIIGNPFELEVRTSSNASSNKRKGAKLKRDGDETEGSDQVVRAPRRIKKSRV
jgi:hypothetical protein